jgi:hypothetical protein
MKAFWIEIGELLNNTHTYVVGIGVGLLGKLSYDIYMKRTLSLLQWFAVIALSVFCGYLTSQYCTSCGHTDLAQVLVPLATLFGEKLIQYVMENHKTILNNVLSMFKRK